MDRPWSGAGRRRAVVLLAGLAGLAGVALVVVGVRAQQSAPRPHPAGALPPSPVTTGSHPARPQARSEPQPLGPSRPTRLRIPAIGVDTVVNRIGLAADGTLAVPQPGPHLDEAAWFENSPTPGQPGPAIIEGHVDSPSGPSVFFRLGALHPGDKLLVTRADGVRLTFTVQAIRDFAKSDFPTRVVYGGDLSTPQLRLITCSDFDRETHHHEGNEVVYSHLTHVAHRPGPGEKAGS